MARAARIAAVLLLLIGCNEPGWTSDSLLSVSGDTSPVLSWPSAGSDVVGYEIELDGVLLEELEANANRFVLEGLREGTTPRVRVIALDDEGNELGVLEQRVPIPDATAPHFTPSARIRVEAPTDSDASESARVEWPEAGDLVGVESYVLTVGDASFTTPSLFHDVPLPEMGENPTLEVRGRDAAGNVSDPISIRWLETEMGRVRQAAVRALQQRMEEEITRLAHDEALGARLRQSENVVLGENTLDADR
ncbi:MAG: hypothetical protein AB8I08_16025 [Sandaracinaceae bacterium]